MCPEFECPPLGRGKMKVLEHSEKDVETDLEDDHFGGLDLLTGRTV
jgi:hypothetical protein